MPWLWPFGAGILVGKGPDMALHFERGEYSTRIDQVTAELAEQNLDGLLMFHQESMYYLTGYDTFGFCFFQCLYLDGDGNVSLLTRAPDLRQAQQTSIIERYSHLD